MPGEFGGFGGEFLNGRPEEDVQRHPELVFDGEEEAEIQHRRVAERLLKGDIYGKAEGIEVLSIGEAEGGSPSLLQIVWPSEENDAEGYLLQLDPISFGRVPEGGTIAYKGHYGIAHKEGNTWGFKDAKEASSLEELLGAPEGVEFIIRPTVDEWAIGRGDIVSQSMGENVYSLYMGLGFLFLGEQWLSIGMHEASHLFPYPEGTRDEQEAWQRAATIYANRHRRFKDKILSGEWHGLFNLLHKPKERTNKPSIGDIMRYGMTSHYTADIIAGRNLTRIPTSWEQTLRKTKIEFGNIIEEARKLYEAMMH